MGRFPSSLITPAACRSLERRLRRWARRRGPAGAQLLEYVHAAPRFGRGESPSGIDPYWLLLPGWVEVHVRGGAHITRGRPFLSDILWAQYCVFLFVRLHDDLLDGDCQTSSMSVVGCGLLMEAERTFARHVDTPVFRTLFRDAIDTTCEAGLRIDALQRNGGARREVLPAYAAAAAIFKLGTAAVCMAYRRTTMTPLLYRFCDEIAIAAQIMDDIHDLDVDVKSGRINYAAACLRNGGVDASGAAPDDMAKAILRDDGIGALADEVERHLRRAMRAAAKLPLPPAVAYAEHVRDELNFFRKSLHHARAKHLLYGHLERIARRPIAER